MLVIAVITPFGHFVYVDLAIKAAGRDAWLSVVVAGVIGLGIGYLQFSVVARYPHQSLTEITLRVFGRIVGTLISVIYVVLFILMGSFTLHISDLFLGTVYTRTPMVVFTICFLALVFWAVSEGIEVIARAAQMMLPVLMLFGVLATVLTAKDKHITNLMPVLHGTWIPVGHGTIVFVAMFSELLLFTTMMSNTKNPADIPKRSLILVGVLTMMFIGPVTGPVMVFGEAFARKIMNPTYVQLTYIEYSAVLERLDIFGLTLWVCGAYLRLSGFCFGATRAITNIFNLKDERKLAWLTVLAVGALTFYADREISHEASYALFTKFGLLVLPVIGIGFPLLTLAVDILKSRVFASSHSKY